MTTKASKALQQLETYRNAVDRHAIVAITDRHGTITHVNDLFCRISGYSRDELIGANHRIINSDHHPTEFWTGMWETIASGQIWREEVCNRAKDGSLFWLDTTISPLSDADGTITGYCAVRTDITDIKRLAAEFAAQLEAINRSQAVMEYSSNGTILTANARFLELLGYTLDELQGKHHIVLCDRAFKCGSGYKRLWDRLKRGEPHTGDFLKVGKDGREIWVQATYSPVLDPRGQTLKIVEYASDITERKHMEAALKESEGRVERAVSGSSNGLWDYTPETDECWYSDKFKQMLGFAPGEYHELANNFASFLDRIHDEDQGTIRAAIDAHFQSHDDYDVTHRLRMKSGDYRWFRVRGQAYRDDENYPVRMAGSIVDVHDQRMVEERLIHTQHLLEQTGRAAKVGGWEIDLATMKPTWTDEVYRIHDVEIGSLVPIDDAINFYEVEARPIVRDAIGKAINQGVPWDLELPFVSATGRKLWVRAIGLPEIQHGRCVRLFGTFQDITAQKKAQLLIEAAGEAAESANRAKSEFLANMSHEIRTPMTAILGYLELLGDERDFAADRERAADAIRTIRRNADHLLTIINDILDMSKIESGKMTVERVPMNPRHLINEAVSLIRPHAEDKGLALDMRFDTALPDRINTDPTRLRQILLNLTGNAVKFTKSGSITVRVSYTDSGPSCPGTLQIAVVDTGIGMSVAQREVITRFDAFTQADGSTTRNFGGSGLGLRISNMLANMLGGGITVESELGVGSTLTATIAAEEVLTPADSANVSDPEPSAVSSNGKVLPTTERVSLRGRHVLLAEDGPDNQRLVTYYLNKADAHVTLAPNGRCAVDLALAAVNKEEPFDVILMDMQMPELDGYGATGELRAAGYCGPIIALTAHAMAEDRRKCLDCGCDDHLVKPFNRRRLVERCSYWAAAPNARSVDRQAVPSDV